MLKFRYQVSPIRKRYKSLGYAVLLAQSLSANLSVNVQSKPQNRLTASKHFAEASLSPKHADQNTRPEYDFEPWQSSKEAPDLIMVGKSLPGRRESSNEIGRMVQKIGADRSPLLVIPYGYSLNGIENVLFTGNAPGLMDEPLLHRFISTFLPRAWQICESGLNRIHWNNVSLMPYASPLCDTTSLELLAKELKDKAINLILAPMPQIKKNPWTWQMIEKIQIPILLFPKRQR